MKSPHPVQRPILSNDAASCATPHPLKLPHPVTRYYIFRLDLKYTLGDVLLVSMRHNLMCFYFEYIFGDLLLVSRA